MSHDQVAAALALLGVALHRELEDAVVRDADARLDLWEKTVRHKLEEYSQELWQEKLDASLPEHLRFIAWSASGERAS